MTSLTEIFTIVKHVASWCFCLIKVCIMPKGQNHLHLSVAGHCVLLMNNLISQLGIIIGGYIYDRGKCGSGKIWRNCPKPATLYRS